MLTEPQAREKWCPMVRAGVYGEAGSVLKPSMNFDVAIAVNRDPRNPELSRCIASACMMWRSGTTIAARENGDVERGYCGLAGAIK